MSGPRPTIGHFRAPNLTWRVTLGVLEGSSLEGRFTASEADSSTHDVKSGQDEEHEHGCDLGKHVRYIGPLALGLYRQQTLHHGANGKRLGQALGSGLQACRCPLLALLNFPASSSRVRVLSGSALDTKNRLQALGFAFVPPALLALLAFPALPAFLTSRLRALCGRATRR